MTIPAESTHFSEIYGELTFYKLVKAPYINSLIDHPTKCEQTINLWYSFDNNKWISVGSGFSDRRLFPISDLES